MFPRTQKFKLHKPSFDFLCLFLSYTSFHRDSFRKHLLPTWSRMCSVQCSPWDECDIDACFSFKPAPILALKWKTLAVSRSWETEGERFWIGLEYFTYFFNAKECCSGVSFYAFLTSISRQPTWVWLLSSHSTGRPLTGSGSVQTDHGTLFSVILFELSLSSDDNDYPIIPFWNSSSFMWITLYSSCFPYFYQNSLFKCVIPKYLLWPLPSHYMYSLGNFCSLNNSCLSFKGHVVHLGSLPSFDAPARCWTTHDYYSPPRSHIIP